MADASEKITLNHEIRINAQGGDSKEGVYPAGVPIEVPKEVAGDLKRMDSAYTKQLPDLNRKRVFERNMGTMAAGSGE